MCSLNTSTVIPQRTLDEFPTELLLEVFGYLNMRDLCRLRQTCERFNEVISCWDHFLIKNVTPLVTNQRNTTFSARCLNKLTVLEKCRISHNWQSGRYKEESFLNSNRKYMPCLYLTNESIWISRGKKIFNYRRSNNVYVGKPICSMWGQSRADVGHFQIKEDLLLCGQRDGSMWLSSDNKGNFDLRNCHATDINSVDISPNGCYIVSCSRDTCLKFWKVVYGPQNDFLEQIYCEYLEDRIWKVSIHDKTPLIAVGTSGRGDSNSLFVYDMQRLEDPEEFYSRSGVSDIKWDGPHTIWSCGFDTYLKRWDLRTGKCEQRFSDPLASALHCLDYDYYNTIMTGTHHNTVILWDIRQPRSIQTSHNSNEGRSSECVNISLEDGILPTLDDTVLSIQNEKIGNTDQEQFFTKARKDKRISPVHSLAFDSEFLFMATDHNLNVLKFSGYDGIVNDYSECCGLPTLSEQFICNSLHINM